MKRNKMTLHILVSIIFHLSFDAQSIVFKQNVPEILTFTREQ